MKYLENMIVKYGKVLENDVLKIDNFLNHQIDMDCLNQIGKEFYNLFKDYTFDKILTVESSGIAVAVASAVHFNNCPVVFAKKGRAINMASDYYSAKLYSYTRTMEVNVTVAKEYLHGGERILILDDFLASGSALMALISICKQAKCEVVGCGVVVEKGYQEGGDLVRGMGISVESLAKIKSMSRDKIEFYAQ